jgi:peptide chain release factor 2
LELEDLSRQDKEIEKELLSQIEKANLKISGLEFQMLFDNIYDPRSAILSIHSGTGGIDAQDWTEMLLKMYLKYSELKKWKAKIINEARGQEAGIKSVTIELRGRWAYGHLKTEAGIHRLVRLSPFNANNLRQTSFALVEVLPQIEKTAEVAINPTDLKIDTFRSGGAGGQSVNKTSSAVRITHIPSGLVAVCQSERSQLQNKEKALLILEAKLLKKKLEIDENKKRQIKGDYQSVQWGSQIRSYVLHPYKLVKDHRTKLESKNPEDILNGNLEKFIEASLRKSAKTCG